MLVLSRKSGQKLLVGRDVVLTVIEIEGNRVRIGIEAPAQVDVFRAELIEPAASRPAPARGHHVDAGG